MALLAFAAVALIGGGLAEGHAGHPQKKLFSTRWYQEVQGGDYGAWMTLSTSRYWYECGTSEADCESRWGQPNQQAVDDWNSQDMTVRLDVKSDQNALYDVNVYVVDEIGFGSLGVANFYDENELPCVFACDVWYVDVLVADGAHTDFYATLAERRGTVAHELGHALSLRHESVNTDESDQYDCEMDDTGEIPVSIMSYDCIDPVEYDGEGIYQVQPWDVCGVNHAYFDPGIGFAGCEGLGPSPTPTLGPGQTYWGDTDCGGKLNIGDSINTARSLVSLPVSQQPQCPDLEFVLLVDGEQGVWGDVDCSGAVNIGDAINISRRLVNLPVNKPDGCPSLGQPVTLSPN